VEAIWQLGAEIIIAIQTVHNPVVDVFFNVVTLLGSEEFYLLLLPLLYWCVDKHLAQRLAYLFLLSAYTNAAFKSLFRHPRPFQYDLRVVKLDHASPADLSYGLPSGHAQSALTVWGYLAIQARRGWVWALALALAFLIAFSRIYLGVHFPSDVVVGLLVGAIWLALFLWLEPPFTLWASRQSAAMQAGLAVAGPLVLLLFHTSQDAASALGVLIGLGVGIAVESRTLRFSSGGPIGQRALRFMIGILIVLALREGLKLLFPNDSEALYVQFRVIRYSMIGLWVALVGPWLFQRIGLMEGQSVH